MRFDPGLLRPYRDDRGRPCVTVNTGRRDRKGKPIFEAVRIADLRASGIESPVGNATSLRKEEWIELDRVTVAAARWRLKAWGDLAASNVYGGFNGMAKSILEHETMSDPGSAQVDMDGLTEGRNDSPKYQLEGLPLPIIHSDFYFSSRKLAMSRNSGTPLDTVMGEAAGRRIAEQVERFTIGVDTGPTYGGQSTQFGGYGRTPSVYGYINFPSRVVKTGLYRPTGLGRSGSAWVAADTLKDVLSMRDALYANKFFGPFMCYHSNDWDQYMDGDYILTGGNVATQTLRDRIRGIDGIQDCKRLDLLMASPSAATDAVRVLTSNPFTLVLVQMTSEVARGVVGLDITTVQWPTVGGMKLNFKVLCIMVPQLRADFYGNCGICHGQATV